MFSVFERRHTDVLFEKTAEIERVVEVAGKRDVGDRVCGGREYVFYLGELDGNGVLPRWAVRRALEFADKSLHRHMAHIRVNLDAFRGEGIELHFGNGGRDVRVGAGEVRSLIRNYLKNIQKRDQASGGALERLGFEVLENTDEKGDRLGTDAGTDRGNAVVGHVEVERREHVFNIRALEINIVPLIRFVGEIV